MNIMGIGRLSVSAALLACIATTTALADGPSWGGRVAAPAAAPPAASAYMVPTVTSWSGYYVGAQVGYGWSSQTGTTSFPSGVSERLTYDADSFIGGVHIGQQQQWGNFVAGMEAMLMGGDFASQRTVNVIANRTHETDIDWLLMVTPRIGYARDNWLGYFKGGFASAQFSNTTFTTNNFNQLTGSRHREIGWTIGAGAAYAVNSYMNLGVEYDYLNFQSSKGRLPDYAVGLPDFTDHREAELHMLMGRLSFKLGDAASRPEPIRGSVK